MKQLSKAQKLCHEPVHTYNTTFKESFYAVLYTLAQVEQLPINKTLVRVVEDYIERHYVKEQDECEAYAELVKLLAEWQSKQP
jgi:hypothetical protein